jgi:Cdc6-like AAA superfamily ATPase
MGRAVRLPECDLERRRFQSFIITSNLFLILDKMPDDARRTLLFKRVDFPAYNATELREIIKERLQTIGAKMPDGTINIISALVAKDDASARTALDLTKMTLTKHQTSEAQVRKLKQEVEKQSYYDYLTKLSPKEKNVLSYIIKKFMKSKNPVSAREISSVLMLSQSRTAQVISDLENYGVVATKMFCGGRRKGNFSIS